MRKILVGFIINGRSGGLDKYLLNFLESVRGEEQKIDLMTNEIDQQLEQQLSEMGVGLFAIPTLRHPVAQYHRVCELICQGGYDTVYLNISTAIDCIAALAAKHCKVEKRVIHSHACGNDCESRLKRFVYDSLHKVCRLFLHRLGTEFYGASRNAGIWMFPEKVVDSGAFHVLVSAVDKDKYKFDRAVREEVRAELGLKDRFVIGHIGNFCYVKNYGFLLDVFENVKNREPNACLLLVGDGERYERVKLDVEARKLSSCVKFLGWRKDTERLVQGMDVFLLPSLFEGLSIVSLEAQCAKLACVMSDTVPEETHITDACKYISLKKSAGEWADMVLQYKNIERESVKFLQTRYSFDRGEQQKMLRNIL